MNTTLGVLGAIFGYSFIKKHIIKPIQIKMLLKKYSTSDNVKIVELPEELFNQNVDKDIKDNELYMNLYEEFGKKIEETIDSNYLDNYYRNFKSIEEFKLSIGYLLLSFIKRGVLVGGGYQSVDNKICIPKSFISERLGAATHESLHASSTYYDKERGIVYSGFMQSFLKPGTEKVDNTFAFGIDEGYTQYLNCKMFCDTRYSQDSYKNEQQIAKCFEKVIGEEKMKELYFTANAYGLFAELEKYVTRDEINKFINLTDTLCFIQGYLKMNIPELDEAKKYVNEFLIKLVNAAVKKGELKTAEALVTIIECMPYLEGSALVKTNEALNELTGDYGKIEIKTR